MSGCSLKKAGKIVFARITLEAKQAEEKQEKYRLRLKVHDKADEAVPCNGFRYLVELRFSRK